MTNQLGVPERAAVPLRLRASPAVELTIGRRGGRRQASIPTVLARKGYWQPGRGRQSVDGTDFLGTCRANGKLTMADLEILCWLCERYRETRPVDGTVSFTIYELGRDLYSRAPGGREAELIRSYCVSAPVAA